MSNKITKRQISALFILMTILIGAVVWRYVTPNQNIEKVALEIEQIAMDIRQKYAHKIDYWGLNTQFVIDNKILTNLSYVDNEIKNALGKPVYIGRGQDGETIMPGERSFEVVYDNLSVGECIALASYEFKHPEEVGLLQITIVSKKGTQTFAWGEKDHKLPISRHKAQSFCTNYAKILWTIE